MYSLLRLTSEGSKLFSSALSSFVTAQGREALDALPESSTKVLFPFSLNFPFSLLSCPPYPHTPLIIMWLPAPQDVAAVMTVILDTYSHFRGLVDRCFEGVGSLAGILEEACFFFPVLNLGLLNNVLLIAYSCVYVWVVCFAF